MRHVITLALALSLASTGALGSTAAPAASATTPTARLHALFKAAQHPAPARAGTSYKAYWGDPGLAAAKASIARKKAELAKLHAIDVKALSPTDQLSWRLFDYQLRDAIAAGAFAHDQTQTLMTQLWGPQLEGNEVRDGHYRTRTDYQRLLGKLDTTGDYLAAFTARLRDGMAHGITQPREVMVRISDEIRANIVKPVTDSPFYAPFTHMPDTIPAAEQAKLQAQARRAINDVVNPAYTKFLAFFEHDYLPHARTHAGVSALPDGKAYYAYLVRHYTTTDMTPDEVHALGLKLVKQIHAEMEAVFKKIGFKGSYKDFVHYLRTDPKFYYSDPADLLEAYRAAAKRIDPKLPEVLSVWLQPRQPWGVHVIPASLAPNTYPAYADVPYMSVNLYKPKTRPKYSIQVLTCHEGRPGHNLQIPVADELSNLPDFRRYAYYNAFGEGWALYSETLCDQPMGLYDNPYAKFGYLNYQMWRAVRLVVDTG
ncbi:MAG TPA: DUF885 domain-containing protein, partial [Rhodanobacteraceae bacterium]